MAIMTEDNEREFRELSAYLSFFATEVWGIPKDDKSHPSHSLRSVPGKVSKLQFFAGLKQAVNDTVDATQDFTPKQVAEVDAACRNQQVLTLSEVRRRYWNKYRVILEKQRICNDTEYSFVVGLLSDTTASIPTMERELLQTLVSVYERRFAQPGG
ncbi:hypothetical protein D1BOALGB6SA_9673 [Olavius sp. associated proteobacterium Delta 1]|nr:hypothetical protein D1BOALGB6SA_9673 [Olavius sp. associated proteobacterium Delta 1]